MTTGRAFPSLRESIHATATTYRPGMKALAAELDWSPSELSMRTTLGGDSARPFPADDEHLVKLMRVTKDYAVLFTMAALLGFEVTPKQERVADLLVETQKGMAALHKQMELILELAPRPTPRRKS